MFVVYVFIHVKQKEIETFKDASIRNAQNSIKEPGVARFDVIQQQDDPSRFVLVEIYYTPEDPVRHKETSHYQQWRDTVETMMVEPRYSIKYNNIYPDDKDWY
jgi:quinol monooxygenase YgiN